MSATIPQEMTIEEFLAMPADGMDRELIRGIVRERPMTYRNRFHSVCLARIATRLSNWASGVRFTVLGGDAGFILRQAGDTLVGIDVAVVSAETITRQTDKTALIDGIPTLAVENLSPSDTVEEIHAKTQLYLEAGVPLVWIIDPYDRTVQVYRPGQPPGLFNERQQLTGEPELPGFAVTVGELFANL